MNEKKAQAEENKPSAPKSKKKYPLLPYLIGLFIMVVVLVLLSYLMQLRNNRQGLATPSVGAYIVTEPVIAAIKL